MQPGGQRFLLNELCTHPELRQKLRVHSRGPQSTLKSPSVPPADHNSPRGTASNPPCHSLRDTPIFPARDLPCSTQGWHVYHHYYWHLYHDYYCSFIRWQLKSTARSIGDESCRVTTQVIRVYIPHFFFWGVQTFFFHRQQQALTQFQGKRYISSSGTSEDCYFYKDTSSHNKKLFYIPKLLTACSCFNLQLIKIVAVGEYISSV